MGLGEQVGAHGRHFALDRAVAGELVSAGPAALDVSGDSLGGRRARFSGGGGDEIGLEIDADRRLAHRWLSLFSGSACPSSACRIFRNAWNTWARALSAEQREAPADRLVVEPVDLPLEERHPLLERQRVTTASIAAADLAADHARVRPSPSASMATAVTAW